MFSFGLYRKAGHRVEVTDSNAVMGTDNLLGRVLDIESGGLKLKDGQAVEFQIVKKSKKKYVAQRVKASP